MDFQKIVCCNCGGNEVAYDRERGIATCFYCRTEMPISEQNVGKDAYNRANELLGQKMFDEAKAAFSKLTLEDPENAEAYWGWALAEYGIEYVSDPYTGDLKPTLHRLKNSSFAENHYVQEAIRHSFGQSREYYSEQAARIDEIRIRGMAIAGREEPYQIFICFKKTDDDGQKTYDTDLAYEIYRTLSDKRGEFGYKVFFSEETLTVGEDYEPKIWAALNSAELMLAFGTRPAYYEATWVKNEWARYLELMDSKDGKKRDLIPVFKNLSHGALPASLQSLPHYVDGNQADFKETLLELVRRHFNGGEQTQWDRTRSRRSTSRRVERRGSMEMTAENFIRRGMIALEDGSFQSASDFFDEALRLDATSAQAFFGRALAELEIRQESEVGFQKDGKSLEASQYFRQALLYADEELSAHYMQLNRASLLSHKDYQKRTQKRTENEKQFAQELRDMVKEVNQDTFSSPAFTSYREILSKFPALKECREKGYIRKTPKGLKKGRRPGTLIRNYFLLTLVLCFFFIALHNTGFDLGVNDATFNASLMEAIPVCIVVVLFCQFVVGKKYDRLTRTYLSICTDKEVLKRRLTDVCNDMYNEVLASMKELLTQDESRFNDYNAMQQLVQKENENVHRLITQKLNRQVSFVDSL